MTDYGFGSASTHDQRLLETFLAARAGQTALLSSVGVNGQGVYLADKGFAGERPHARWQRLYDAEVIPLPHQRSKQRWSKAWRIWLVYLRQLIESVFGKLLQTFGLARECPYALDGFSARRKRHVSGSLQQLPLFDPKKWNSLHYPLSPFSFSLTCARVVCV